MGSDFKETFMKYVFMFAASLSVISIILIFYFIFEGGLPFILEEGVTNFIFGTEWRPTASNPKFGILPMIVGSIIVTLGAVIVGVPVGIMTSIFMAHFCPPNLYRFAKPAINMMAAIPSIVYGFFALQVFVPISRNLLGGTGMNIVTASVLLGIMILPTIIGLSESSIRAIPRSYYEASVGLGATHERSVMNVVVPAAKSGIISAVILGIGRAIGETMAVILVTGNQPVIPSGLNQGVRTLTTNIVLEMGYASGRHQEALIATAVVLFIFILIINAVFMYIKSREGND
ncbi:phosphate ABC transporter permease subunit PstC [Suicoccus acidiformans]|nr:phosphate ABC transporter permease subunit PstC [Suicoccus acidiformans]